MGANGFDSPRALLVGQTIFLECARASFWARPRVSVQVWHGRIFVMVMWRPLKRWGPGPGAGRPIPATRRENWHTTLVKAEFPWWLPQGGLRPGFRRIQRVCRAWLRVLLQGRPVRPGCGARLVPLGVTPWVNSWNFTLGDHQLLRGLGQMQRWARRELMAAGFWIPPHGAHRHLHVSWNN